MGEWHQENQIEEFDMNEDDISRSVDFLLEKMHDNIVGLMKIIEENDPSVQERVAMMIDLLMNMSATSLINAGNYRDIIKIMAGREREAYDKVREVFENGMDGEGFSGGGFTR